MKRGAQLAQTIAFVTALTGETTFRYGLDTEAVPKPPGLPPNKMATPSLPVKGKRKKSRAERKREKARR